MMFERAWIAAHIPHQGAMCLLDGVLEWDTQRIVCLASSHHDRENPLRSHGRLHAACGIEYAAQAMAVHGALCSAETGRPRAGFLASVRGVEFSVDRLDDIASPLTIAAERLGGDGSSELYGFVLSSNGRRLLDGRAAVILDAAGLAPQSDSPLNRSAK